MTQMEVLDIAGNPIPDLSPLAKMTSLEKLFFQAIDTSDIEVLSQLVNLGYVTGGENSLSSLDAFSALPSIYNLQFPNNQITTLVPLVANENFDHGTLNVTENLIACSAEEQNIVELRSRGIKVSVDCP